MGRLGWTCAILTWLGVVLPLPSSAQTYSFSNRNTYATSITLGPDGALWFTETTGNVGRITTDGTITEFPLPTPQYQASVITSGPDGAVWFVEPNSTKIARITSTGAITEFPVPITPNYGGSPLISIAGMTAGPDGALWFTDWDTNAVWRITTAGATTSFPLPCANAQPGSIVSGPDGALWFTENAQCSFIGRITTSGAITQYPIPNPHTSPTGLIVGPDGALWYAEEFNDKIGRITTAGAVTEFPVPPGTDPISLTTGSDGAVWYANQNFNNAVRLASDGTSTSYHPAFFGLYRKLVVTGSDGAIWFVLQNGFGRLNLAPLTVALAGSGTGNVQGAGLNCGNGATSCTELLSVGGDNVNLTATAAPGSTFVGWSGGGCSGTSICAFLFSGSTTVTANFQGIGSPALNAAILPASRSVQTGTAATAFATMINSGPGAATGCTIVPNSAVPMSFEYQTTDATTNAPTGTANTPVTIQPGQIQSFVISLTPNTPFTSTDVPFAFSCSNANPGPVYSGLNTLLLSSSAMPVPDVVALAATTSGDGILDIPLSSKIGAFAVAVSNVGATGTITASADTASAELPVSLVICETNPATGACLNAPAATVTTTINNAATPTFGIFATADAAITFSPASNRIFVRFRDSTNVVRGTTDVAIRTH